MVTARSRRGDFVRNVAFLMLPVLLVGCGGDGGGGSEESSVSWIMQAVNFDENGQVRGKQPTTIYLYAASLRAISYKAEISTGTIVDGQPDTLEWVAIKDDPSATEQDMLNLDNPEIVSNFPLEPGTYENFRITVSNYQYMGYADDPYEYEVKILTNPDLPDDAQVTYIHCPIGIVGYDGDGNFAHWYPNYPFEGFTLETGSAVTIRQTLNSPPVAWTDADSDSIPEPEEIDDNVQLPEGKARVVWDIVE